MMRSGAVERVALARVLDHHLQPRERPRLSMWFSAWRIACLRTASDQLRATRRIRATAHD